MNEAADRLLRPKESGAALVTVILITFILLVACIAMLSAVGAGTANSADVLAESKAYYAAETGLQATINVLRNYDTNADGVPDGIDYSAAISGDGSLSTYLSYCDTGDCSPKRVVFGNGGATYVANQHTAYSINVSDPDNSAAALTFTTVGGFIPVTGATVSEDFRTIYVPDSTSADRTEITYTSPGSTTVPFPLASNPSLGTFSVNKVGTGAAIPAIDFRIDYYLTAPRGAVRSIRGTIPASGASADVTVNFISQIYDLLGSRMELCNGPTTDLDNTTSSGWCSTASLVLSTATPSRSLYAYMTPVEAYRLKVVSTGYGPHGAMKKLEGIIQKDFFNGLASGAATTMIGPSPSFVFDPGTSAVVNYSGCDVTGELCVPSFGFTDPDNLEDAEAVAETMNGTMDPPPALLGNEIPSWQSTPAALDALVDSLRAAAQNSGRYFVGPSDPADPPINVSLPPGSFTTGTGITFCESSCKINTDGGGILVVTGKLTNVGGWDFKGMIIVTGEEGWLRNGGGGGQIIGNVIIAPYNQLPYIPESLSSTFLSPQYVITGGGASDIIYSDISATFDGTSSISNFMLGVSEK